MSHCRLWDSGSVFVLHEFAESLHPSTEELDAGAAEHGSLENLQLANLTFCLTVAPLLADGVAHGVNIVTQPAREDLHRRESRGHDVRDPGIQRGSAAAAQEPAEAHCQRPHASKYWQCLLEHVDLLRLMFYQQAA